VQPNIPQELAEDTENQQNAKELQKRRMNANVPRARAHIVERIRKLQVR
jgi:hypothetical protein